MTKEEALQLKPFDMLLYIPTNKDCLVKRVTDAGIFCIFRIQSTAELCKFEDLKIL
jgi:hypothetical protein